MAPEGIELYFEDRFCALEKTTDEENLKKVSDSTEIVGEGSLSKLMGSQYVKSSLLEEIEQACISRNDSIVALVRNYFLFKEIKSEHINAYLKLHPNDNVNATDCEGRTLLDVAADLGDVRLIKYLIKKGANLEQKDRLGCDIYKRSIVAGVRKSKILTCLYKPKG